MRSNLLGVCSAVAAVAVAGSAMASVTFTAGGFGYSGSNSFSVPASGSPNTVVSLGINFTGALATSLGAQNLAGAVAKTQVGPAGMGGLNDGPAGFVQRSFASPLNDQYAAQLATTPGTGFNPSMSVQFALANAGNGSPNAWTDPIVIKYAVFRANGSFAYRHAWLGTYTAGATAGDPGTYTFSTVFWATGAPTTTGGKFAGSSWTGNWGDAANPDLNWGYVYTSEDDRSLSYIQANTSAVPAPGAAALIGLAGLVTGRRRKA